MIEVGWIGCLGKIKGVTVVKKSNKKIYILLALGGFIGGLTIGTIQSLSQASQQVAETVQESAVMEDESLLEETVEVGLSINE